jgi:hypothetical protein
MGGDVECSGRDSCNAVHCVATGAMTAYAVCSGKSMAALTSILDKSGEMCDAWHCEVQPL